MRSFNEDGILRKKIGDRTIYIMPCVELTCRKPSDEDEYQESRRTFSPIGFGDPRGVYSGYAGFSSQGSARNVAGAGHLIQVTLQDSTMSHIPVPNSSQDLKEGIVFDLFNMPTMNGYSTLKDELEAFYSSALNNFSPADYPSKNLIGQTKVQVFMFSLPTETVINTTLPYMPVVPLGFLGSSEPNYECWYQGIIEEVVESNETLRIGASNKPFKTFDWPRMPSSVVDEANNLLETYGPDRGQRVPIVYGNVKRVRLPVTIAPIASSLALPLDSGDSASIVLTDASNFPTPKTVEGEIVPEPIIISGEEASYSGIAGNTLTDISRGLNDSGNRNHLAGATVFYSPSGEASVHDPKAIVSMGEVELRALYVRIGSSNDLMRCSGVNFTVESDEKAVPGVKTTFARFSRDGWWRTVLQAIGSSVVDQSRINVSSTDETISDPEVFTFRPIFNESTTSFLQVTEKNPYSVDPIKGEWTANAGRLIFNSNPSNTTDQFGRIKMRYEAGESTPWTIGDDKNGSGSNNSWNTTDLSKRAPRTIKWVFTVKVDVCEDSNENPIDAEVAFFVNGINGVKSLSSGSWIASASFNTAGTYKVESKTYLMEAGNFSDVIVAEPSSQTTPPTLAPTIDIVPGHLPSTATLDFEINVDPISSSNPYDIDHQRPNRMEFTGIVLPQSDYSWEREFTMAASGNSNDNWDKSRIDGQGGNRWNVWPTNPTDGQTAEQPSGTPSEYLDAYEIEATIRCNNHPASPARITATGMPGINDGENVPGLSDFIGTYTETTGTSALNEPYTRVTYEMNYQTKKSEKITCPPNTKITDFSGSVSNGFLRIRAHTNNLVANSGELPSVKFILYSKTTGTDVTATEYNATDSSIVSDPGSIEVEFYGDIEGQKVTSSAASYHASNGSLIERAPDCLVHWASEYGGFEPVSSFVQFSKYGTSSNSLAIPNGTNAEPAPGSYKFGFDARMLGQTWDEVLCRIAYESRINLTRGQYGSEIYGFAAESYFKDGDPSPSGNVKYQFNVAGFMDEKSSAETAGTPSTLKTEDYIDFKINEKAASNIYNHATVFYNHSQDSRQVGPEEVASPFKSSVSDNWVTSTTLGTNEVSDSRLTHGKIPVIFNSFCHRTEKSAQDWVNYMVREYARRIRICTVTVAPEKGMFLQCADLVNVDIPAPGYDESTDSQNTSGTILCRVTGWSKKDSGIEIQLTEIPDQTNFGASS